MTRDQKLYAILNTQSGLVKIGIAANPKERLKDLECGSGTSLELLFEVATVHARTAEAFVHGQLGHYRAFREWFHLPDVNVLPTLFSSASTLQASIAVTPARRPVNGVRWKVKAILDAHGITINKFKNESGLAQGTAYRLANGMTDTINVKTFEATIETLRRLTGKEINIGDIVEYVK